MSIRTEENRRFYRLMSTIEGLPIYDCSYTFKDGTIIRMEHRVIEVTHKQAKKRTIGLTPVGTFMINSVHGVIYPWQDSHSEGASIAAWNEDDKEGIIGFITDYSTYSVMGEGLMDEAMAHAIDMSIVLGAVPSKRTMLFHEYNYTNREEYFKHYSDEKYDEEDDYECEDAEETTTAKK